MSEKGARAQEIRPVDLVEPRVDSARSRWIHFASAARPFGTVRLSPDTDVDGDWGAGYLYGTRRLRSFSHVHEWQLAGIPVLPTTGPNRGPQGSEAYQSRFRHETETVHPGYHSVTLEDYGIRAELTSTTRVGFHRYTFPASEEGRILFDLGAALGPSEMSDTLCRRVGRSDLEGYVVNAPTRRRPKHCPLFFVARLSRPFKEFGGWAEGRELGEVREVSGAGSGAFVGYSTLEGEKLLLKVGISYVSVEQARLNLETELPHWDFDRVVEESRAEWNEWLSRIEVRGGTEAQRTKLYTDLWHVLLGRGVCSDVDGKYSDMTGPERTIRQTPPGPDGRALYHHYNSDAFWNSQWSLNILWPLLCPDITSGFCRFFLDMYDNGGLIPRGPSGGNYTFVMTSAQSTPFLVSAYMKGIRDFDVQKAYRGMRKNAFPGGLMGRAGYEHHTAKGGGIEYYIERGYIPEGREAEAFHVAGAGQTLEYAYQDWCLAQMARELGKTEDYRLFSERSQNYRNLYDERVGFMRPRNPDGSWVAPFDPLEPGGWVEANAWSYTWFVPHDLPGLFRLMGGREAFNEKLNYAFERAAAHDFINPTGHGPTKGRHRRFHVDYGNQPSTSMAHLFNYSGAPWLTQKWVREVKERAYGGVTPFDGYRGDEDQGEMGSLGVLMAIGLFQVRGGAERDPVYEITSPIFDEVIIHLDPDYYPGDRFVIRTRNNSRENRYIRSASLNGERLEGPWFCHHSLAAGGLLEIELGAEPNREWGADPEVAPFA